MASLWKSVIVLIALIVPVSTSPDRYYVTDPVACYILDGILIIYCITATALYIREKLNNLPPDWEDETKGEEGIYQDLNRPKDADPYQVLQSKGKGRAAKNKKAKSSEPKEKEKDSYETLPSNPPQAPVTS